MLGRDMSDRDDASPDVPRTPPAPPPAPAAPSRYDDEISLRELYLILRRGLPLIAIVTVIAAVAAFAVMTLRPDVYESEATVVSAPTTIEVQEQGALAFAPRSAIAFETYQDIASSRATFEQALALLREAGVEAPPSFRELRAGATVERLAGPSGSNPSTPLTVVHRIAWDDAALAASYADAWAEATVEQVRSTLMADLEPTREQTLRTIEALEVELQQAEAAVEAFAAQDLEGARQRLATARSRAVVLDELALTLDLDVARLTDEVASWAEAVGTSVRVPLTDAAIDLLVDLERLDPTTAARWRTAVAENATGPEDVTTLVAATELQDRSVELAGKLAERAAIEDELAATALRIEELQGRVARLEAEERGVVRRLDEAASAYGSVRSIEPALAFVTELTPSNTRVLNRAQEPIGPAGVGSLLVTAIAAVVAALAATLFVFLREAVRDPAGHGG
jgi:uncharacterized protein involved in exopolysaccharide biosynthesis